MGHPRSHSIRAWQWVIAPLILLPLCTSQAQQPPTEPVDDSDAPVTDVVITQDGNTTMKEFKRQGQTYKIEITPDSGIPYYLYDVDGDGQFESANDDMGSRKKTTKWRLFQW